MVDSISPSAISRNESSTSLIWSGLVVRVAQVDAHCVADAHVVGAHQGADGVALLVHHAHEAQDLAPDAVDLGEQRLARARSEPLLE